MLLVTVNSSRLNKAPGRSKQRMELGNQKGEQAVKAAWQPWRSSNSVIIIMLLLDFWQMIAAAFSSWLGLVLGTAKLAALLTYAISSARNGERRSYILGFLYVTTHILCSISLALFLYISDLNGRSEPLIYCRHMIPSGEYITAWMNIGLALLCFALVLLCIFYSQALSVKKTRIIKIMLCMALGLASFLLSIQFLQINSLLALLRFVQLRSASPVLLIASAHMKCRVCGAGISPGAMLCKKCGGRIVR